MSYYYSPGTGGFYLRAIHGAAVPADAIEITDERHADLMAGQAAGQRIVAAADGHPVLAAYAEAAPAVPRTITRLQARLTCLDLPAPGGGAAHLWAWLEQWAASTASDTARAFFEDAAHWRRDDPLLLALAADIGLDADDLDDLFILAATR
jgi:hypothetical protein